MNYILVGLNYKTTPVAVRERFYFSSEYIASILNDLQVGTDVAEAVVLATCNRTEIYAVCEPRVEAAKKICCFLQGMIPEINLKNYIYIKEGAQAAAHLFRVCCGIDSLLRGEKQILGQVRQSYQLAVKQKTVGAMLSHLFHQGISLGRSLHYQLQSSFDIDLYSKAVISLISDYFDPGRCKVLVIGAGKIAGLIARGLYELGNKDVLVSSRNMQRVAEFIKEYGGKPFEFDEIKSALVDVDVVISSTAAPHFIVKKDWVAEAALKRNNRDLLMLDLAIPRDIEPEVKQNTGVYLYNIDELADAAEIDMEREEYLERAESMINRAIDAFIKWQASRRVIPILKTLREKMVQIGLSEQEKTFRKLAESLDAKTKTEIERLLERTINKIIHLPTVRLKEMAIDNDKLQTFREIFGLAEIDEKG